MGDLSFNYEVRDYAGNINGEVERMVELDSMETIDFIINLFSL